MKAVYTSQRFQWTCEQPLAIFSVKNGLVQMTDAYGRPVRVGKRLRGRVILDLLQTWQQQVFSELSSVLSIEGLDLPFLGGPVGFFSYEFGMDLLGQKCRHDDDLNAPDVFFSIPSQIRCTDSLEKKDFFMGWGVTPKAAQEALHGARDAAVRSFSVQKSEGQTQLHPEMDRSVYNDGIARIKEYLKSGDTYQVNFAQRFCVENSLSNDQIFHNLSDLNPSPHMFYCAAEEWAVVSNSPEQLLRVWQEGSKWRAETRPIKGTISRGATPEEDEQQAKLLRESEKDAAELVMIVDLCRNDLGRVSQVGSVRVTAQRVLEKYSHVWHTVSTVQSVLKDGATSFDAFPALFPGGSVTGCPKYRTIQIIDHLEPVRRGVYTGSAGYFDFRGGCDFNILIRTIWQRGDRAWFHVGGGVVFDSTASGEYQETLDKAEALVSACGVVLQ